MVEILALVLHHDEQAVLTAVELALEAGVLRVRPHVLNLLARFVGRSAARTDERAAGIVPCAWNPSGQRGTLR